MSNFRLMLPMERFRDGVLLAIDVRTRGSNEVDRAQGVSLRHLHPQID